MGGGEVHSPDGRTRAERRGEVESACGGRMEGVGGQGAEVVREGGTEGVEGRGEGAEVGK